MYPVTLMLVDIMYHAKFLYDCIIFVQVLKANELLQ